MIFKIPDLKGYVKYENGEFSTHEADSSLRYMKLLMEIAKEWVEAMTERTGYDNN